MATEVRLEDHGMDHELLSRGQVGKDGRTAYFRLYGRNVRQSGRFLELQNRDIWIRPADLCWQITIIMTIREEPFKNYRSRPSARLKTMEDKIEEAKKQEKKRSDDEWNYTRMELQTKRVSVLECDRRVPGSHHSCGSEE